MAGPNPLVNLGVVNRLASSVLIPAFPQLNVTAPFVGKGGIKLAFDGKTTEMLGQMVGNVLSPNVYITAMLTIELVKTQTLAALYKQQMETYSPIGDISVRSDSSALPLYNIVNAAIEEVDGLDFSGASALFGIKISGTYYLNSNLWNL